VLARTGLTFRQLKYARSQTTLEAGLPAKVSHREWPEAIVRRLEIAVALDRAVPKSNVRHSGLPAILQAVLDAMPPPEAGWVLYGPDGKITYTVWTAGHLEIDTGGLVARIPEPWAFGERPEPAQGWAIVEVPN
jgi:hypothetical protein